MTHELQNPPVIAKPGRPEPIDPDRVKNDDDLKYVPVWLGEGKDKELVEGGVEHRAVLEELEVTELPEDFDYTDYLASTGQIVFSEDDPRAANYADNENYQAAATSLVADAFKAKAERERHR